MENSGDKRSVFSVCQISGGRTILLRIGEASVGDGGEIRVQLEALPSDGRLLIAVESGEVVASC